MPEKIDNRTSLGTAAVMIANTNAIDRIAPVFCSIMRVPPAMPRRCAGTAPIIAAVLGELNMPEPIPTTNSQTPSPSRLISPAASSCRRGRRR